MADFNSPLSLAKADQLIHQLQLTKTSEVLDIGCGTGVFLLRTTAQSGARGIGIDIAADLIETAAKQDSDRCEFRAVDIAESGLEPCSFDVVICMGSTYAYGMGDVAYPNAVKAMSQLVRPGGRLLIGEGYWKQPPAADYLAFIGDPVGVYCTHQENIAYAEAQGLTPVYATTSNQDEWDDFEWSHLAANERHYRQAPTEPERIQSRQGGRQWINAYLRWGRETMGFGLYIFQK